MSFHGEVTQLDGSRSRSLSPNPQRASHWCPNYKLPTKEVQGKNEFETKVSNFLFKSALITIFHFKPTIKVDWLATVAVLDWNISSSCFIMIHVFTSVFILSTQLVWLINFFRCQPRHNYPMTNPRLRNS